jgi:ribosome-binding protein aMBF1 (putative translation factor)
MSDTAKVPKVERTPEQRAEERRIREMHRQNPIREIPTDTISGADAARLLSFVAAVKREREVQGLTVEQIAESAGLEPAVLARFESGQTFNPSISTLFRLAKALKKNLTLGLENG